MHELRLDTDGDSSTPKLDTPIMMKNFLCDTAGVAFNKEMPLEGSTVIEEGISFDENMAIVNTSALLDLRVRLPHKITVRLCIDETRQIGAVDPSSSVAWY